MHMTMHFQIKVFKIENLSKWLSRHIFIPQASFFSIVTCITCDHGLYKLFSQNSEDFHAILESHDNARVLIFNLRFLFFRDSTWNMVT